MTVAEINRGAPPSNYPSYPARMATVGSDRFEIHMKPLDSKSTSRKLSRLMSGVPQTSSSPAPDAEGCRQKWRWVPTPLCNRQISVKVPIRQNSPLANVYLTRSGTLVTPHCGSVLRTGSHTEDDNKLLVKAAPTNTYPTQLDFDFWARKTATSDRCDISVFPRRPSPRRFGGKPSAH